ncbi:hypothetical protein [Paenibacillus koleovorans]|uniref:hypothetical protein n=1 Tax=Paenibacillus koleovorans TaxID=121608 RepID=UPI000FDC5A2F|nr:hypothetical protein [Paenibacillus koleovorans]
MLFKQRIAEGIAEGRITLAFRRWEQLRVKPGSRVMTVAGVVEIVMVARVEAGEIRVEEAELAGYSSVEALMKEVDSFSTEGTIYRMAVRLVGADPRERLREQDRLDLGEGDELVRKLDRLDRASPRGAWTRETLLVVSRNPGVRAAELAEQVGMETEPFKLNVRKLKNLGLTISLGTGYRISPRGEAMMKLLGLS